MAFGKLHVYVILVVTRSVRSTGNDNTSGGGLFAAELHGHFVFTVAQGTGTNDLAKPGSRAAPVTLHFNQAILTDGQRFLQQE